MTTTTSELTDMMLSPIVVSPRLIFERGLARRWVGGEPCSDRTFFLVLAARALGNARRRLLDAGTMTGANARLALSRAEELESAVEWLVLAERYRVQAHEASREACRGLT